MVNNTSTSIRTYERDEEDETEEVNKESEELECPECGSDSLIEDPERGETVCQDCGLVVDEGHIDQGPEWRAFDSEERDSKARVGAPRTEKMHDKGLSTEIDWQDKDAFGNSLSSNKRAQMKRLRKWHKRSQAKGKERGLRYALGEIDRMGSALNVPENTREVASMIQRRAVDEDLLPGRSIEGVAAAALYAALRQGSIPRSIDEVAEVSRVDEKELARTYRYIMRELGLEIGPTDPVEFVPRIASELELSSEVEERAKKIIRETSEQGLASGKSPKGYAAAAIYLASMLTNEKRTQQEIAEVADITEVTIRNRYQEQAEHIGAAV
ncbi:MAG: transcription initiation factor IIB [Halobacteria archaeon]|nr:transcription initiation factor IIB [Halobacteria archaeon]